jgi:hypothetical protein
MSTPPYLRGFENVDIARSFMWVESTAEDPQPIEEMQPEMGLESVVGTPEDESIIAKIQHNAIWLSTFVSQLSSWLAADTLAGLEVPASFTEEEAQGTTGFSFSAAVLTSILPAQQVRSGKSGNGS